MVGKAKDPDNSKVEPLKDITTTKETPGLLAKGFIMGSADVVPGVSGGTMALILGIYIRLIHAIKSVNAKSLKSLLSFNLKDFFAEFHWRFLFTLLLGILGALIFFTRVIPLPVLMHTHPELIYGLFFGLIAGSVLLLIREIQHYTFVVVAWLILGTIIGILIVNLVPVDLPSNPAILFGTGAIAITALILPGISGSFLLLILRQYDVVLGAFRQLGGSETIEALWVLVPFGLGMVTGIMLFVRFLSWLLAKYRLATLCVLIGFMIGSLYIIWPFQEKTYVESERIEVVSLSDPRVLELQEVDVMTDGLLEFERLGHIVNPTEPVEKQKIELIEVKLKMVSSKPFIPTQATDQRLSRGSVAIWHGFVMLGVGFLIVIGIGYYASAKSLRED